MSKKILKMCKKLYKKYTERFLIELNKYMYKDFIKEHTEKEAKDILFKIKKILKIKERMKNNKRIKNNEIII